MLIKFYDQRIKHFFFVAVIMIIFIAILPEGREPKYSIEYNERRVPGSLEPNVLGDNRLIALLPVPGGGNTSEIRAAVGVKGKYVPSIPENITLILNDIFYEVRDSDYAVISGLNFDVFSNISGTKVLVLVYLYDDNDPLEHAVLPRARIPFLVKSYNFFPNESRTVLVHIPFNELNKTKTLQLAVVDYYLQTTKIFGTLKYEFSVSNLSPVS